MEWERVNPYYEEAGPYRVTAYKVGSRGWRYVAWRMEKPPIRLAICESPAQAKTCCDEDRLASKSGE